MKVSYDTNMMGPWSMEWYRKRGLTEKKIGIIDTRLSAELKNLEIGDSYTYDEITTYYSGGRIDIYGLPEEEFFDGKHEYSVPIMHSDDWKSLGEWLRNLNTEELMTYDEIILEFEKFYGKKIRWDNND